MPILDPDKRRQWRRIAYRRNRQKHLTRQRAYYEAHKTERAAYNKAYAARHVGELHAYYAKYRTSDMPGAITARANAPAAARKWRLNNLVAARSARRAQQAARRAAGDGRVIVSIETLLFMHDELCAICGGTLTVDNSEIDHAVPLSRGGKHRLDNLRPLHSWCNRTKLAKLDDELTPVIVHRCRVKSRQRNAYVPIPPLIFDGTRHTVRG